jgi:hypothetical protein
MSRVRKAWFLLLLSIFWVAQVQGTVHAISHVQEQTNKQSLSSHSIWCVECAALAQAGAAPPPSLAVAVVPILASDLHIAATVAVLPTAVPTGYLSRAPPVTPI